LFGDEHFAEHFAGHVAGLVGGFTSCTPPLKPFLKTPLPRPPAWTCALTTRCLTASHLRGVVALPWGWRRLFPWGWARRSGRRVPWLGIRGCSCHAGGPFELEFHGEGKAVKSTDVWVGEVWLASGQSNMERQLAPLKNQRSVDNGVAEAAKADYPRFRQFHVPRRPAADPRVDVGGLWKVCSPETARDFSAVGFFFARELMEALDVPVGIIHSSVGGTPVQAWTSEEAVSVIPKYRDEIEQQEDLARRRGKILEDYRTKLRTWFAKEDPGSDPNHPWSDDSITTEDWRTIQIPLAWEAAGFSDFDGVVWLRRRFELTSEQADQQLQLALGPVDDFDTTWVNDVETGSSQGWSHARSYAIPQPALRVGTNEVVVRVLPFNGNGGIWDSKQPPALKKAQGGETVLSLAGSWKIRPGLKLSDATSPPPGFPPPLGQRTPGALYNGMIAPLVPYAIRGVIWYQGEANSGDARTYRDLFPTLIADWRAPWGRGDFPFLFVQIAPHKGMSPEIREAQLLTLGRAPNTAMAVTIDVGDANDIHPTRKEPVGERLALAARALAYGETIVYSGPIYESVRFENDKAVVSFKSVGPGLTTGDGEALRGFVVAGNDGVFHPARAEINGDVVIVSSDHVSAPRAVATAGRTCPMATFSMKPSCPLLHSEQM
jgi:sialate O-acetylesterase